MNTKNTLLHPVEEPDKSQKEEAGTVDAPICSTETSIEDIPKKLEEEQPQEDRKFYNIISMF